MNIKSQFPSATFSFMVVAIVLAIFLRFTHLDVRPPDHDEVFTALRVSGSTEAAFVKELLSPQPVAAEELQKYQRFNPAKTLGDSVVGLAKEEPQLTPLYYASVRVWASIAGSSIASLRSWAAILSLLAFPALYWLCLELFNAHLTASLATILLAVSPYYLVFSQGARHYSLWATSILFMSAALLRARRDGASLNWTIYALTFAFSLYACLLSLLVGAGHLLYTILTSPYRLTRTFWLHGMAMGVGFVAFLPWVILLHENLAQVSKTAGLVFFQGIGVAALARGWVRQPGKFLYEVNLPPVAFGKVLQFGITGFGVVFALYALYFLWRTTSKDIGLFILTLILATGGGLVLQDLTLAGHAGSGGMSNLARYLIPCFLGLILAIAHLFSMLLTQSQSWRRQATQLGLTVFLVTQLISSVGVWQSPFSTPKIKANFAAIAQINQFQNPLLIAETGAWDIMHYTQALNPDVQIMALSPTCYTCNLSVTPEAQPPALDLDSYQHIFLFPNPSAPLITWAKQQTEFDLSEVQLSPDPTMAKLIRLDRQNKR
jgi:uncharacterized membrane protein